LLWQANAAFVHLRALHLADLPLPYWHFHASSLTMASDSDVEMAEAPDARPQPGRKRKTPATNSTPKRLPKKGKSNPNDSDGSDLFGDSDEHGDEVGNVNPKNGLDLNLPPISDVGAAFDDLVANARSQAMDGYATIDDLAAQGGFEFSVGTMCSGTEAPIAAMRMIQDSYCAKANKELFRFKHVFSVEIEPYKQAYIKRNTDAKVYRDVREFAADVGFDA
jgi:hypothetical protein